MKDVGVKIMNFSVEFLIAIQGNMNTPECVRF